MDEAVEAPGMVADEKSARERGTSAAGVETPEARTTSQASSAPATSSALLQKTTEVRWYVGIPFCGKTWLAKKHLGELVSATGWPALILDSIGEQTLQAWPHARSMREAIEWVWGAGQHATYIPRSLDEVEALARACCDPGGVNLFIDESHSWLGACSRESPLLTLMRTRRHARANILMTTQHYTGDIPHEARSCAPRTYVFRCTDTAVLDALRKEGLDISRIPNLPPREYIEHYRGF